MKTILLMTLFMGTSQIASALPTCESKVKKNDKAAPSTVALVNDTQIDMSAENQGYRFSVMVDGTTTFLTIVKPANRSGLREEISTYTPTPNTGTPPLDLMITLVNGGEVKLKCRF